MKYLILILTLLFSFNLKAETYACAFQVGVDGGERINQEVLRRERNIFMVTESYIRTTHPFEIAQEGLEADWAEGTNLDHDWIVLTRIRATGERPIISTRAINKVTLEYRVSENWTYFAGGYFLRALAR